MRASSSFLSVFFVFVLVVCRVFHTQVLYCFVSLRIVSLHMEVYVPRGSKVVPFWAVYNP